MSETSSFLPSLVPDDEIARLNRLRELRILDTTPEQEYEDLTQLAALLFQVPIALISLVDEHRQWFKSQVGLSVSEMPRSISFCGHAIHQPDIFIVPDAAEDRRFRNNPLVLGDPNIRFYAGMPLTTSEGSAVGTLCVIDRKPRTLSRSEELGLRALGRQVMAHFQLRRHVFLLEKMNEEREKIEQRLRTNEKKLREANLQLQEQATTDPLTGLRNRRAFDLRLRHEWKLSGRLNVPVSLLLIDVDRFKTINDTWGHSIGDAVLKQVAAMLEDTVRETDFVSRFGGEEFAVLLPATSHSSALKVAENVRAAVATLSCEKLDVTISIGVSSAFESMSASPPCHLIEQADAALYEAKGAGRNRVASAEYPQMMASAVPAAP